MRLALKGLLDQGGLRGRDGGQRRGGAAAHRDRQLPRRHHRPQHERRRAACRCSSTRARVDPDLAVIMITAYGSEKIAVQAMKLGAVDYLPKPFDNDELRVVVRRVMETVLLRRDHRRLLEQVQGDFGFEQIVGRSPAMRRVFETIDKVADTDVTVLIRGESGTGKELVANALHYRSPRRAKPMIKMNCAALSRELVESELFGHERGAFTGAIARREGKFEAADGGTLFLDEVGDMPLETQAKLLRALAGEGVRARRRQPADPGRRARARGDQPGSRGGGARRALPRRPLLPAARRRAGRSRRCTSGARTSRCSIDHFLKDAAARFGRDAEAAHRRRAARLRRARLEGQRARAALGGRAGAAAGAGREIDVRRPVRRATPTAPPPTPAAASARVRRSRSATPRPQSSKRSSATSCSRRCAATAATSARRPRRSACTARTSSRRCASSASASRTQRSRTGVPACHRSASDSAVVTAARRLSRRNAMRFIARVTTCSAACSRSGSAAASSAIRPPSTRRPSTSALEQYDTLREAAAGVLYLRSKLASELERAVERAGAAAAASSRSPSTATTTAWRSR